MNAESLAVAQKAVELYALSHPRPSQVNKQQAAEMANISIPTLRKMIASGIIKLNKFGLVATADLDAAIGEHRR